MTDTGFSSWVTGDGAAMHAAHAELARRFMRTSITPALLDERGWPKQRWVDAEPVRSRAETRESFAQRISARRKRLAGEASYAAD